MTTKIETQDGSSQTLSREECIRVLQKLQNNFRRAYQNMTRDEAVTLAEVWVKGLQRIDGKYIEEALDWFIFSNTDPFPPTIGQFLAKANEFKAEYEKKHPVIRNAWEIH